MIDFPTLLIPEAWKWYPFRVEPPCIGHYIYREYSIENKSRQNDFLFTKYQEIQDIRFHFTLNCQEVQKEVINICPTFELTRATIFQSWKRIGLLKKKLTFWMDSLIVAFKTGEIDWRIPIDFLSFKSYWNLSTNFIFFWPSPQLLFVP